MKKFGFLLTLLCVAVSSAWADGWPSNFEGVMLQGFYWDSYQIETKWTKLEARSDELSPYFKLIWVPNGGKSSGGLGYIPIYWFTNHNSDMGTESQLRSMIATYKAKGTEILTDLVINHRNGVTSWADFPTETWNGKQWHIGMDGICRTDEINQPGNPGGATGANDEGQDFDGARDLDHTNANVQENCKNYCKFLLEDMGYAGYRIDMVKGYAGYYTKMYNQYAKPKYSVGEYFDSSYDALAQWIENTGGESAAFDFAFKYAVNDAFASGDMRKLVWYENGETPKPAGLIHHWYQKLAVTFIDNHDTYRDDWNRFNGNWAAANAFMICSPGTPCVFLPHWNACGDQIGRMIKARNAMGVHNMSDVRVLRTTQDCYMAEVTGTKGKLVVKVGPAMVSPDGYTDSQIYCSGEDYCIWTSKKVTDPEDAYPAKMYIVGVLPAGSWKTNVGVEMTRSGAVYTAKDVELAPASGSTKSYFTLVTKLSSSSSDWNTVNSSDRYGATSKDAPITAGTPVSVKLFDGGGDASSAYSWSIPAGTYDITVDLSTMKLTATVAENRVPDVVEKPAKLYVIGNLKIGHWDPTRGIEMTADGDKFVANSVKLEESDTGLPAYFSFATTLATKAGDWDTLNSSDRYGAETSNEPIVSGVAAKLVKYPANVSASGALSWSVTPGDYKIEADFKNKEVTLTPNATGVEFVTDSTFDAAPVYYTLTGQRVTHPENGSFYIVRRGSTVTKTLYR